MEVDNQKMKKLSSSRPNSMMKWNMEKRCTVWRISRSDNRGVINLIIRAVELYII